MLAKTKAKILAGLGALGSLASIVALLLYLNSDPGAVDGNGESAGTAVRGTVDGDIKSAPIDVVGDANSVVSDVGGDVTINVNPVSTGTFINNPSVGSALLLLEPDLTKTAAEYQVCIAPKGTKVEKLETQNDPMLPVVWVKVEILAGEHKGKAGWVSQNNLEER